MSRPRKKWEPEYRFGGNKASWGVPVPLGQAIGYRETKKPKPAKKGKSK